MYFKPSILSFFTAAGSLTPALQRMGVHSGTGRPAAVPARALVETGSDSPAELASTRVRRLQWRGCTDLANKSTGGRIHKSRRIGT
jgi:hypothetical protein